MKSKMKAVYSMVWFLVAAFALGNCYCPPEWQRDLGNCSYWIHCQGDVRGLKLHEKCQASSNYLVNVMLTLDSPKPFDESLTGIDFALVASVTSFRVNGKWPQEDLALVEKMYGLTEVYLIGNQIQRIEGRPFFQLVHLETVDLSHNKLTKIDNLLQIEMQPSKLRKLSLAYNAIKDIPDDAFDQVTSLVELDLSNNSISNLNNMTFGNLSRLEVLKLSNNQIYDLDGALNSLTVLKHLYLGGNQIQKIDLQSVQIIYDLETFDVSFNQLENLVPDWLSRHWHHFGSRSTCKIILSNNYITSLPNATSQIKMTRFGRNAVGKNFIDVHTELDLSKNSITDIEPYALHYIMHLKSLDLSSNKLITFVINAEDLQHVQYLNLSNNYISYLHYESFSYMRNLQNLDLSFNNLDDLADQTFQYNFDLRYVNMSNNYLQKIKNLRIKMFHPEGGVLDLSKNSLSAVNIPHGEGLRLKILSLHSNNISDLTLVELCSQEDLRFLDLSYNHIQKLSESTLHLPSSLLSLDLAKNDIISLGPSTFKSVAHLHSLRLPHNRLENIDYGAFNSLASLSDLDLSYNKIYYLDSKVLIELKSLKVLSLRFNEMHTLDYSSWIGHRYNVRVIIDGNAFSCPWLATALSDYSNGFSKMEPTAAMGAAVPTGPSLEGISCENPGFLMERLETDNLKSNDVTADERLLVLTSKILEAIKEQTKIIEAQRHFNNKK